jgi:hypothetical protein
MANTIAGVNLAAIAEMSIEPLMSAMLPLRAFTTDFSSDIADRGASVTTRYATVPTAQDLSTGYSGTDVAMTALTITLNTFYGFVWRFNDTERSKSSIRLNDLFINPAANALAKKVFGDIWNLVNDTNYPAVAATELTVTAANFDRDDVADIAGQLTINGVPRSRRSLILHPTYYAALAKDLNAADSAGQVATLGENRIPRVHGFDVYESPECDGNSVNVTGLACHNNNLLVAARQVDFERAQQAGVEVQTFSLPDLELPVQLRRWYNPSEGNLYYSMGVLYGVLFGLPSAGLKIVSA